MNFTKIAKADLDSPCQDLSNGGLKSVIAPLVRRQIDCVCVCVTDRQSSCSDN